MSWIWVSALAALAASVACTSTAPIPAPSSGPPADRPGWQRFRSERYGFEVALPLAWTIRQRPEQPEVFIIDTPDPADDSPSGMVIIVLDQSLEGFFLSTNPSTGSPNRSLYRERARRTIDGRSAVATYGGCCGGVGEHVFVDAGDSRVLQFSLYGSDPPTGVMARQKPDFDRLVASLRFR